MSLISKVRIAVALLSFAITLPAYPNVASTIFGGWKVGNAASSSNSGQINATMHFNQSGKLNLTVECRTTGGQVVHATAVARFEHKPTDNKSGTLEILESAEDQKMFGSAKCTARLKPSKSTYVLEGNTLAMTDQVTGSTGTAIREN